MKRHSWTIVETVSSDGGPRRPRFATAVALTYADAGYFYRVERKTEKQWIVKVRYGRIKPLTELERLTVELLAEVEKFSYEMQLKGRIA